MLIFAAPKICLVFSPLSLSLFPCPRERTQALEVIKKLKEVMPIDRAKMKLRITTDDDAAPLREALGGLGVTNFEAVGGGGGGSGEVLDFLVDPGIYRDVEEAVRTVAGCVPRVVSRREMRVSAANFCFSVSLPVSSRKRKQLGLVSWKRREGLTVFGHNFRGAAKEPCGACCRQAFSSCLCALHRVCVAVLTCVLCSLPPPTRPNLCEKTRVQLLRTPVRSNSGRCALEVLQLSVQQEGEADMDVELLRKEMLAVKLKGEEEGRNKNEGRGGKGGDADAAEGEGEEALMMPGRPLASILQRDTQQ